MWFMEIIVLLKKTLPLQKPKFRIPASNRLVDMT